MNYYCKLFHIDCWLWFISSGHGIFTEIFSIKNKFIHFRLAWFKIPFSIIFPLAWFYTEPNTHMIVNLCGILRFSLIVAFKNTKFAHGNIYISPYRVTWLCNFYTPYTLRIDKNTGVPVSRLVSIICQHNLNYHQIVE